MTVRTNLYGCFHMTKAALPHLCAGAAMVKTDEEIARRKGK